MIFNLYGPPLIEMKVVRDLSWCPWWIEGVPGLDGLAGGGGVGDAVLVLGVDPEVVVGVDDQVPHPGVAGGDVGGHLGPLSPGLGVGLLDDVVGDGAAAVVPGGHPVEGQGLAGKVGRLDVPRGSRPGWR